ncbi:MAG: tRNA (adenosine(37)-N6)-dimethylallyltransferase MiaA [Candidatus Paceibacterota bacterium]
MSTLPKILVILGPTAIGKSDLAVELALRFDGEIISADSRQVYRGLDIGTGKITDEEMKGVPHHLLDVADPSTRYAVTDWKEQALKKIENVLEREKLPIICGGTGLYIQSVVDNTSFPEVKPNETLRNDLKLKTTEELFQKIEKLDPKRAKTIDRNNSRRLIRAIEIATEIGYVPDVKAEPLFSSLQIGLTLPREKIKERIHTRLYRRLESGLIEEVQKLHDSGLSFERMIELGLEYKYVSLFLQKELTRREMETKLETEIYRYAKRQETWFKRDPRIHWLNPSNQEKIVELIEDFL